MRTLLLNANYFPIRIIPLENAIKRMYEGTVDVVASYDETVRSPSVEWKVPAVLRDRRKVKVKPVIRFSRDNVYLRDGYRCQYCGDHFDAEELTYDHVVPRAHGGKTTWDNIVSACHRCNSWKADRECDECGMFPITRPVRPVKLPMRFPRSLSRETAPAEWLAFLPA
jgi:5-methylcytosine-specific restriction endonuclease McrA